jgi:hypothetical protein
MNQYKVMRFMEIFWLSVAVAMALISIYLIITAEFDVAKVPLFATFSASILYGLRRYQRRKIQFGIAPPDVKKTDKKN